MTRPQAKGGGPASSGRGSRERDAALPFEYFLRQRASSFGRTLAATAVLSILVIAGVSAGLAWRQYQHAQRTAASDLKARVVVAAAVVDASFAGQISTLTAIADAPAVVAQRKGEMRAYFKRIERGNPPFNGGLGWIDKRGELEVSSSSTSGTVDLSQRTYVRKALTTGKPYVSAGLIGRRNGQQVIVTAVATRDRNGRITGVLAGSTRVKAIGQEKARLELGYAGLLIVDRSGQQLFSQLAHIKNAQLLRQIENRSGVVTGVRGLNSDSGHIVAFAGATVPGWTIAIDRPESAVYAAARRSLALELASVATAALLVLVLLAFVWRRSRRQTRAYEARARAWSGLTRILAAAATPEDVADGLIGSLVEAFPADLPVVSLRQDEGALRVRSPQAQTWSTGHRERVGAGAACAVRAGAPSECPSRARAATARCPPAFRPAAALAERASDLESRRRDHRQPCSRRPRRSAGRERMGAADILRRAGCPGG